MVSATVFVPASPALAAVDDPASIVDPFLGTSNSGDTFPGADAPFGMVQWSPDTTSRPYGGGYKYADTAITGFSLTHISGPGCAALGDVPILPTTGAVAATASVGFSHTNESASAGAYAVTLSNGVKTELTATTRSGMARFTFPATTQANLLFKLTGGATAVTNPVFTVVSSTEVSGSVTSGHFCGRDPIFTTYFDIVFDQPFTANGTITGGDSLTFNTTTDQTVQAKVGVSFVGIGNATANRVAENAGWDFAGTQTATHDAWNALLGRTSAPSSTPRSTTRCCTRTWSATATDSTRDSTR
jgi:putative alpha-1,2-mannosidase